MAKKKEETKKTADQSVDERFEAMQAALDEHAKAIENFRTSFQNLETAHRTLKERNRLR